MKILVCTDGSEQSQKAIEKASKISCGCNVDEVAIIYVYEPSQTGPYWVEGNETLTEDMNRRFRALEEQRKEESKKILSEAALLFTKKNIKVNTIFKEGRPAETIVRVSSEEGFDLVVLGSRGISGLKKMFLGSVSNAVLNEVKSDILIVK